MTPNAKHLDRLAMTLTIERHGGVSLTREPVSVGDGETAAETFVAARRALAVPGPQAPSMRRAPAPPSSPGL